MDTPALPLADLPPRPIDAWREHTAKNWKSSDPESYAVCIEMITQHGITSISDLQRELKTLEIDKSRQTIAALMRSEFSIEQLADLAVVDRIRHAEHLRRRMASVVVRAARGQVTLAARLEVNESDHASAATNRGPSKLKRLS